MRDVPNPMAQAWLDAARDLGIRVQHPFPFRTEHGVSATTQGVHLPDFGSRSGTLLTCRFDPDEVCEIAETTDYFQSALSPHFYEPYSRAVFVETLNDWGWFGTPDQCPPWFSGRMGHHGSAERSTDGA